VIARGDRRSADSLDERDRWPRRRTALHVAALGLLALSACESHPVPENPTWVDVEPILRARCLQCHGGSASLTASLDNITYRFDFFDVTAAVCGEAASAVQLPSFAAGWSGSIARDITSADGFIRPRMPPLPATTLADWEWQTLLRWTAHPEKGAIPEGNRPPTCRITNATRIVDAELDLGVVVEDPDGESAIGILTIGDTRITLDRPGAFLAAIDTSAWAEGEVPVSVALCDGWNSATYGLGSFTIQHHQDLADGR
jgi:hypothetical protein